MNRLKRGALLFVIGFIEGAPGRLMFAGTVMAVLFGFAGLLTTIRHGVRHPDVRGEILVTVVMAAIAIGGHYFGRWVKRQRWL